MYTRQNSFADPINTKMIKETLTLFLAHQQQTLEYEDSLGLNNESTGHSHHEQISELTMQTEEERVNHAAKIFQVRTYPMHSTFLLNFYLIQGSLAWSTSPCKKSSRKSSSCYYSRKNSYIQSK